MELTKEEFAKAVARGWCHKKTADRVMDVDLAKAITEEVWNLHSGVVVCEN